ncbi:GNAT family N-acetyltransferase [Lentzea sp.]|uniref:GNAT family N-acetyltransferase n=1 Tax=Lentzea sp. TaxID=56099 RepID=UPI002ED68EAC
MASAIDVDVFADIRARYFPMKNESSGLVAESCDDAAHFTEATSSIFRRIFTHEPAYAVPTDRRAAAERLLRVHQAVHHERFLISDGNGAVVGWMCGEMEDRSTFYLRSTGFLPEHRLRGAARFYPPFLAYLRDLGYERITSHHHPHNSAAIIMQLKMGFVIDGMTLDERHGPMVKLVLHVHDDRKREYLRRLRLTDAERSL